MTYETEQEIVSYFRTTNQNKNLTVSLVLKSLQLDRQKLLHSKDLQHGETREIYHHRRGYHI